VESEAEGYINIFLVVKRLKPHCTDVFSAIKAFQKPSQVRKFPACAPNIVSEQFR
jgi:hypothetical protein